MFRYIYACYIFFFPTVPNTVETFSMEFYVHFKLAKELAIALLNPSD